MRLDRASLGGGILLAVGFLWEPFGGTPQERTWVFLWVFLYFLLTARFERTRRVWDRLISEGGWVRCQLDGTWKTWWSQWSFQEGIRGGSTLLFAWFLFGPFDLHPHFWDPEWTAPNTWMEAIEQTEWNEPWQTWWSCMFLQGIAFYFWSVLWAQISLFWAVWLGGQRKAEERIPWDLWMVFPFGLVTFFPLCDPSLWFQTLTPTLLWAPEVIWVAFFFGVWCIGAPYLFSRWVNAVSPF